jgi:hypothetical protein
MPRREPRLNTTEECIAIIRHARMTADGRPIPRSRAEDAALHFLHHCTYEPGNLIHRMRTRRRPIKPTAERLLHSVDLNTDWVVRTTDPRPVRLAGSATATPEPEDDPEDELLAEYRRLKAQTDQLFGRTTDQ